MDISLLSRMVGELILTHDEVTLPDFGTFVATVEPAGFSDRGYTINPPYRKLSFEDRAGRDNLLSGLYASSNRVSREDADSVLQHFFADLKEELAADRSLEFPGLGRLKLTKDGRHLFVADRDLDIYPQAFGLSPVSLRSHGVFRFDENPPEESAVMKVPDSAAPGFRPEAAAMEATRQQTAVQEPQYPEAANKEGATHPEAAAMEESATRGNESAVQGGPVDEVPPISAAREEETASNPAGSCGTSPKRNTRSRIPVAVKIILILALTVAAAYGVFMLLVQLAPDFIDSLLYTPEELEILNW